MRGDIIKNSYYSTYEKEEANSRGAKYLYPSLENASIKLSASASFS